MPRERVTLERAGASAHSPSRSPSRWAKARRVLAVLFVAGVLGLLVNHARTIDWAAVAAALQELPARSLWLAAAVAAASHAVYATYDLIGRHQVGHRLPALRVAGVTFVSYAFNLNLGALVGGVAFRYRLYARQGLSVEATTEVLALSMLTNWLGYLALAAGVLLLVPLELPAGWGLADTGLRALGVGLALVVTAYLAACHFSPRRHWQIRGHAVSLPTAPVAWLQLGLSCLNWLLIAAVVHVLLQGRIDYATVLGVLLLAAVAGVVTHVPAGLGVLEAVFVALLSNRVGQDTLLAALLAYRAIYYLGPLAAAIALFPFVDAPSGPAHTAEPRPSRS